jgi:hypothetical protein
LIGSRAVAMMVRGTRYQEPLPQAA